MTMADDDANSNSNNNNDIEDTSSSTTSRSTTRRQRQRIVNDTRYDILLDYILEHQCTLHPIVQVGLTWMIVLIMILYYGYQYLCLAISSYCYEYRYRRQRHHHHDDETTQPPPPLMLPLMTTEYSTRNNNIPRRRPAQSIYEEILQCLDDDDKSADVVLSKSDNTSAKLISLIRQNTNLRRLASEFGMSTQQHQQQQLSSSAIQLYYQLQDIWMDLLRLPPKSIQDEEYEDSSKHHHHDISLIVPAYRENGYNLVHQTLRTALNNCVHPHKVQVIVVDAGQCTNLQQAVQSAVVEVVESNNNNTNTTATTATTGENKKKRNWSEIKVVDYCNSTPPSSNSNKSNGSSSRSRRHGGSSSPSTTTTSSSTGGRGQTLNYGASCSNGKVLVFLHSDCLLPENWDQKVMNALQVNTTGSSDTTKKSSSIAAHTVVHACAFRMGVTDDNTTSNDDGNINNSYQCWGIRAVQFLANVRSSYFKMPYGDQAISIPATYFHYIGGFPNQPIMEDYDFMDYLRRRAFVMNNDNDQDAEKLAIIPGSPVRGSIRRWQRAGVIYVTLANALLVHRYTNQGWTAEDVFAYYYQRPSRSSSSAAANNNNNNNNSSSSSSSGKKND